MNIAEIFHKIKGSERIIIFGAESKARELYMCCNSMGKETLIVVSRPTEGQRIEECEVQSIYSIAVQKEDLVLICTNERYHCEIMQMKEVRISDHVYGLSMSMIMEIKRLCILDTLKRLGIDLRVFKGLDYNELLNGTYFDMDQYMMEPRKPSMISEMWRVSVHDSAEYAVKRMRNARAYSDVDEYHKFVKTLLLQQGNDAINLEFGVAGGNLINYFSESVEGKFYGFDAFEGLPEPWMDGIGQGKFAQVALPNVNRNIDLVVGYFDSVLPRFVLDHNKELDKLKFIHIDCDLYSSTKTIFCNIGNFIKPGTIIAFDEYINYPGWQFDEFKAFQEWVACNGISYKYIAYVENNTQVCVEIQ